MRLSGKVAIITGANAGIGEAIALDFAREGATVVITGRRKDLLDQAAQAIERTIPAAKGRVVAVSGTVTDDAHVRSTVDQAVRAFGKIDILVNNAAIGAFGKLLHEIDDATWEEVLAINLTGVFQFTRAVVPEMLKLGGGSIINISSVGGLVGFPMSAAYGTSKGGLNAFTRCVALDYGKNKIRCNAICPGLVDTPMAAGLLSDPQSREQALSAYAIRRVGTPKEIASMAVYLASDESQWVTGSTMTIDGGLTAQ
jgi:NAD(P)-dependent dehydrogenase (short-subunit alcohol dehydrogenase family)